MQYLNMIELIQILIYEIVVGVCMVIGMVLYPWGWGSPRVIKLCGQEAAPFYLADCTLGIVYFPKYSYNQLYF